MGNSEGGRSKLSRFAKDLTAGIVVFLVALPLCLGIAVASNADPFSGIVSGVIGGVVVGLLSGSHTSVSGPAAGLTAIVAAQIAGLGSFELFLAAVMIAGVIQIGLGYSKAGFISAFVPSSVIKGLLSAIGLILIINQLPKLVGHQNDVIVLDEIVSGQASHVAEHNNALLKLFDLLEGNFVMVPAIIGISSMLFLLGWERIATLKKSIIPAPLIVVVFGIGVTWLLERYSTNGAIPANMLVSVPVLESWGDSLSLVRLPDFQGFVTPAVYIAGLTIAIVASLETLLNLEAVDKIDPKQRFSPPSKELFAQGVGNVLAGLIGGLPMTSVIVRSSVNINAGGQTRVSAIVHGLLLFGFVICLPQILNKIPYASLAAILVVTGFKLMSWKMIRELWESGKYQFAPFLITVVAIVTTDLLIGILVGLGCSLAFVLYSNYRRPIRRVLEKHIGGDVLRIELANQVSFLSRAALDSVLRKVPKGGRVLIDASNSDYIDPDILALIRDFDNKVAPARRVQVSLIGFESRYEMKDVCHSVDYTKTNHQRSVTPSEALRLILDGNARFRSGVSIHKEVRGASSFSGEDVTPLAFVLTGMDAKLSSEVLFDSQPGEIYEFRLVGNGQITPSVLASLEFQCQAFRPKLILLLQHIPSRTIHSAIQYWEGASDGRESKLGGQFRLVAEETRPAIDRARAIYGETDLTNQEEWANEVVRAQIILSMESIQADGGELGSLVKAGQIALVGMVYDARSGRLEVMDSTSSEWKTNP